MEVMQGFKFKGEPRNINYVERANANGLRPLLRWIDKVFIVDSVRDYQFYVNCADIDRASILRRSIR